MAIDNAVATRVLLSGNEAIARGAVESGIRVATGYPGTPSTEILETLAHIDTEGYVAWSPNEKVALDVGVGGALAGSRTLVTMKHVGLNVAADTLMSVAYTGVRAALVIVSADDPGVHRLAERTGQPHLCALCRDPLAGAFRQSGSEGFCWPRLRY